MLDGDSLKDRRNKVILFQWHKLLEVLYAELGLPLFENAVTNVLGTKRMITPPHVTKSMINETSISFATDNSHKQGTYLRLHIY